MEAIDESVQRKRQVDHTLARFSAVHDEIAEEERRKRARLSRFMPWRVDEEMEEALSSRSLPVAKPVSHQHNGTGEKPAAREPASAVTRLQAKKLRKHERVATTCRVGAVAVAVVVFLMTGFAWGTKAWLNGKFHLVAALDENSSDIRNAAGQQGDENFLLVGSDTRAGISADDNAGDPDQITGARSDTVMVAHIPTDRKRVTVASLPRDLEVTRPACARWNPVDGTYAPQASLPAQAVKLNSVYAFGGPKCLTTLVQRLSGLKINHFVGINFDGFKEMVDAVGGVSVCTTTPLNDTVLGTIIPKAGTAKISGDTALNYVRARHVIGDPTSDYGRMTRGYRFLSALLRNLLSQQVLLNPRKLNAFVQTFARSTFGENIDLDQMLTLAQSMRGLDSGRVTFVTVPTTGVANARGNEVLRPADNRALFDAIINGTPLPGDAAPSSALAARANPAPQQADPTTVKIQVLNAGNATDGIAKNTSNALAKQGFHIMQTQNAPAKVDHTVIKYAADAANQARTLAAAVPGATLQEDPSAEGAVILMIGPEFDGKISGGQPANGVASNPGESSGPPLSMMNAADSSCP